MNNRILISRHSEMLLEKAVDKEPVSTLIVPMDEIVENFKKMLMNSPVVKFSFVKADGTVREAYGTWKLVPEQHKPQTNSEAMQKEETEPWGAFTQVNYYDLGAGGWRKLTLGKILTLEL